MRCVIRKERDRERDRETERERKRDKRERDKDRETEGERERETETQCPSHVPLCSPWGHSHHQQLGRQLGSLGRAGQKIFQFNLFVLFHIVHQMSALAKMFFFTHSNSKFGLEKCSHSVHVTNVNWDF